MARCFANIASRACEAMFVSPRSYICEPMKLYSWKYKVCLPSLNYLFLTSDVFVLHAWSICCSETNVCTYVVVVYCGLGELTKCQIWHFDFQTARESLISEQGKAWCEKTKRKIIKRLFYWTIAKSLQKFCVKICCLFLLFSAFSALFTECSKCCFQNHAWFPP